MKILENCDLFITQCGHNSYLEALSKGVPILAVPQTTEQFLVAKDIKRFGQGDIMLSGFTIEAFSNQLKNTLNNTTY